MRLDTIRIATLCGNRLNVPLDGLSENQQKVVCAALVKKVGGDDRRISITAFGVLSCTLMGEHPAIATQEAFAEIDRVMAMPPQTPAPSSAPVHSLQQGSGTKKKTSGKKSSKKR